MNKWLLVLLLMLLWASVGVAIFGFQVAQEPRGAGLPSQANRIVSTAPSLTEILFALGLGDKIVGVTLDSDYPPAAVKKPKVGTFWQPNIEAVIAAKPDLVITLGFEQQRNLAERLKRIGYKSLTLDIEKISELFGAIESIGVVTGKQAEAEALVSDVRKKLNNLSSLVGAERRVKVLWVVQREPLRVAGRDTFINEMLKLAGGENAIGPTLHKYPPIGAEQVIASGAEVIIEPAMWRDDLAGQKEAAVEYWSKFKNVPAVKEKHVYVIDGDTVSRLGPRVYEGTETIARCLRPELFAE